LSGPVEANGLAASAACRYEKMKCLLFFALLAGYRLPAGKHTGILPNFRTKVNKKLAKKCFIST
jgi:hypothetical protein